MSNGHLEERMKNNTMVIGGEQCPPKKVILRMKVKTKMRELL